MFKLTRNVTFLLLGVGCIFIILVFYLYFNSSGTVTSAPKKSQQDFSELDQVRLECFDVVDSLDYKDDTKFNEFRSIYDYRLYKYNECLKEHGVEQF